MTMKAGRDTGSLMNHLMSGPPAETTASEATAAPPRKIVLTYTTIDRLYERRVFKTLKGARKYARKRIGTLYDISETFNYAVDMFGTGKLTATGATLDELLARGDDEKEATT